MPAVTMWPVRNGVGCPVSRAWWSAEASRCGTLSTTHTIAAPNVTRAAVRAAPDSTPLRARPSMPGTSSAANTRTKMCDGTHSGSPISAATAASPDSVGSPIGCSRLPRNPRIPPTSSSHGHRVRHDCVTGGRRRLAGFMFLDSGHGHRCSPSPRRAPSASETVGSAVTGDIRVRTGSVRARHAGVLSAATEGVRRAGHSVRRRGSGRASRRRRMPPGRPRARARRTTGPTR